MVKSAGSSMLASPTASYDWASGSEGGKQRNNALDSNHIYNHTYILDSNHPALHPRMIRNPPNPTRRGCRRAPASPVLQATDFSSTWLVYCAVLPVENLGWAELAFKAVPRPKRPRRALQYPLGRFNSLCRVRCSLCRPPALPNTRDAMLFPVSVPQGPAHASLNVIRKQSPIYISVSSRRTALVTRLRVAR